MIEFLKRTFWRPIFNLKNTAGKWYEAKFVIPQYSEKRAIILEYKKTYGCDTFVETGTFLGETVEVMRHHFKKVYSIELAEALAIKAQKRFEKNPEVTILQGDSGTKLGEIVPILAPPVLYWLDGHFSGSMYIGDELVETASGDLHSPIIKELECLLAKGIEGNVILIDDARLFVGQGGYPEYNSLVKFLEKFNISPSQISQKRDIIRIIPA